MVNADEFDPTGANGMGLYLRDCCWLSFLSYDGWAADQLGTSHVMIGSAGPSLLGQQYGWDVKQFYTESDHLVVLSSDRAVVVSVEGTDHWTDWWDYLDFLPRWSTELDCFVFSGLLQPALDLWRILKQSLDYSGERPLFFVGHSRGGAMATILAALNVMEDALSPRTHLVTFGAPKALGRKLGAGLDKLGLIAHRVITPGDSIPGLPVSLLLGHVGHPVTVIKRVGLRLTQLGWCQSARAALYARWSQRPGEPIPHNNYPDLMEFACEQYQIH